MKNLFFTALAYLFTQDLIASTEVNEIDKGFFLKENSAFKNYKYLKLDLKQDKLVDLIQASNYKIDNNEANLIAKNIIKVSKCIQIDPWFLTALINKESSFDRYAVSPTFATGLTQFTRIGFEEVNDQLGIRGYKGARLSVIAYNNDKIKTCIDPKWKQIWDTIPVPYTEPGFYVKAKEILVEDITIAITYGAVLLKTYLAHQDGKVLDDTPAKDRPELYEIYYRALMMYNGEAGNAKELYAKNIMNFVKKNYPRKVDFPKIP